MSIYLFDEHPIIANKTLARVIGLNEALILQQINYWIEINKKTGNNRTCSVLVLLQNIKTLKNSNLCVV